MSPMQLARATNDALAMAVEEMNEGHAKVKAAGGEDTEKSMTMADVDPSATPDRNSNKLPVKTATEKSPARRRSGRSGRREGRQRRGREGERDEEQTELRRAVRASKSIIVPNSHIS